MQDRFDRIDEKLDSIQEKLNNLAFSHHEKIVRLETQQKGIIALCVAVITAALGTLAKALHL